jgi:aspartate racemase
MVEAAQRLKRGGAEAIVICTNTMHLMADAVERASGLPVLHIVDATAEAIRGAGCRRPLLLATRFTMEQPFYRERLRERHGIEALVPEEQDRETVHRIIYDELCQGVVRPESKAAYLDVIQRSRGEAGADGVILGCTEITLLIGKNDVNLPVFDATRLHAEAAMAFALGVDATLRAAE